MANATKTHEGTGKDVYGIITDKIIAQLEQGVIPWTKPWKDGGLPRNLFSQKPYRGINVMLLAHLGYEHNLFLTSKQLNEIGGAIKPDEKPHLVVYWNYGDRVKTEEIDAEETKKKPPVLRYYTVFNISQCSGIPDSYVPSISRTVFEIENCEAILKNMPSRPQVTHKVQKAYYDPLRDYVNMPKKGSFGSDESYYSTLWHELVHSTGHRSRLSRPGVIDMVEFGSEPYSHEELVAEIGTCYLQSHTGITGQFEQSTAYIRGWLQKLKGDRKFIFSASTHAQKAVDFILDVKAETEGRSD